MGLLLREFERDELGFEWITETIESEVPPGTTANSSKRRLASDEVEEPQHRQIPISKPVRSERFGRLGKDFH